MDARDIFLIILTYLCGSISSGYWYAKLIHKEDIRKVGSGNPGATNIGRRYGFSAAFLVTVFDIFKVFIPMFIARRFLHETPDVIMAMGIAGVLGHAYPVFSGFKGGKVVATSFGALAGYSVPKAIIFALILFVFMYITSTVSVSALGSFTLVAIYMLIFESEPAYKIGFVLIAIFMFYRHKDNIKRIINKEERIISFGLTYKYRQKKEQEKNNKK